MHLQLLSLVVAELGSLLSNARVVRFFEGSDDHSLYIAARRSGKNLFLLLSADRVLPRIHLVSHKPPAAPSVKPFTLYLKSRISGGTIRQIALLNQDRIVEIRVARQGRDYRLVFELTGAGSNFILTDAEGTILALFHPGPAGGSSLRPVMIGAPYILPPQKKFNAVPSGKAKDLSVSEKRSETASPNREAEILYGNAIEQRRIDSERRSMTTFIRKLLRKTERRAQALSEDLKAAQEADLCKQAGDAILANLKILRTGMVIADLETYEGSRSSISLDPRLSPVENAELYFKKYKKARAGQSIISERLLATESERTLLAALLADLEQGEQKETLFMARRKLEQKGYIRSHGRKTSQSELVLTPYRKFEHQGWDIYVGKTAAGNDILTTKIASPDDLWLHAEGLPGSHVIVRNPQAGTVPQQVLEHAASLAAYFSKGKNATKVPVTYCDARFVKKPKGAKPGMVTLARRRTIMVKPRRD
jgi:predicted ribosome quality control (RQC) complex YloA/Tae2 family protein